MLSARILAVALMALVATQAVAQDKEKKKKGNQDGADDLVGGIWAG